MYRQNDRSGAIEAIQRYLRTVGNQEIFVAPTGVYDDNTRLSVIDFQGKNNIEENGIVDKETFDMLFYQYSIFQVRKNLVEKFDSFIQFPILPGQFNDAMIHINRTLSRLLDYYGHTHNLFDSNFYSASTSEAVEIMREIYLLGGGDYIDEVLYDRMITDHNSIFEAKGKIN